MTKKFLFNLIWVVIIIAGIEAMKSYLGDPPARVMSADQNNVLTGFQHNGNSWARFVDRMMK